MKVALYARVSTQNGHQDPELQLAPMREFAKARGWEMAEPYIDHGVSGAKESRPALNRLMADAKRRKFDGVLVWKFDRFARSTAHLLRALEEFKALGIEFVSLTEGVDTSTPMGKMVFTVLGAVAELERSLIVERVKAGMRNAKAKGHKPGPKGARIAVDLSGVRNRIAFNGESMRHVAASLGVSPSLLSRRLKANE